VLGGTHLKMLQDACGCHAQANLRGSELFDRARIELVGERWTLLIIRDALLGVRRFDEFQENLGIARCSPARSRTRSHEVVSVAKPDHESSARRTNRADEVGCLSETSSQLR
jgi:HxlR-like helix-turn-helix